MSPVHVSPGGGVGIELVKEMVPALVEDCAVRIVIPIGGRMEVIHGTRGILLRLWNRCFHRFHCLVGAGCKTDGSRRAYLNEPPASRHVLESPYSLSNQIFERISEW